MMAEVGLRMFLLNGVRHYFDVVTAETVLPDPPVSHVEAGQPGSVCQRVHVLVLKTGLARRAHVSVSIDRKLLAALEDGFDLARGACVFSSIHHASRSW